MTAPHYARLGYAVLPLRPGSKLPATAHGLRDATTDPRRVAAWEGRFNIGLLPPAQVLVLDADSAEEVERLEHEYPELLSAPRCDTPSGGAHLYLRLPEGATPPKTGVKVLGRPLDLRGLGKAYLLAPPSTLPTGAYRWARPLVSPTELPEVLGALLELVSPPKRAQGRPSPAPLPLDATNAPRARRYALSALQGEHDAVASAPEGSRNHALNRGAFALGQLVGAGALERAEVEDALRGAAQTCGLEPHETEATLRSGLEAGVREPRELLTSKDAAPKRSAMATSSARKLSRRKRLARWYV